VRAWSTRSRRRSDEAPKAGPCALQVLYARRISLIAADGLTANLGVGVQSKGAQATVTGRLSPCSLDVEQTFDPGDVLHAALLVAGRNHFSGLRQQLA
jgi:hypothetical protein